MNSTQSLKTILLIDDNPDDRLLAIREISREFPEVKIHEIIDMGELNSAIENGKFDLVITDYEINWTNGIEILQRIKSRYPNIPVVMFTNSGSQEIAVEAMKLGLDDYVVKSPQHFIRLSQAVRIAWENSQNRTKVKQLEDRLQFLLNELKVGVFRRSINGQIQEVNQGFLEVFGLQNLSQAQAFFDGHPELKLINCNTKHKWEREIQIPGAEKDVIWVLLSEACIDLNGETVVDGLISDITDRKIATAKIEQLNQTLESRVKERTSQLEAANKELEVFAYSISHDLRSPIRQINGFVNLLLEHLSPIVDETVLHYIEMIVKLTVRAGRMIDDLLQLSRTGRSPMYYTTVDMNRLVAEIRQQQNTQIESKRQIIWKIEKLPLVKGDRSLLRQVWQNLIENAVKYTNRQEIAEITIASISHESNITFMISDNGVGFDMRYADKIFAIFQRLHSNEEFTGTGIGLANVQRIIHRHGGQVWAQSAPSSGAKFYFSLPRRE